MEWNGNVQKYIHIIHGQLTFDKSAKCSSTEKKKNSLSNKCS